MNSYFSVHYTSYTLELRQFTKLKSDEIRETYFFINYNNQKKKSVLTLN